MLAGKHLVKRIFVRWLLCGSIFRKWIGNLIHYSSLVYGKPSQLGRNRSSESLALSFISRIPSKTFFPFKPLRPNADLLNASIVFSLGLARSMETASPQAARETCPPSGSTGRAERTLSHACGLKPAGAAGAALDCAAGTTAFFAATLSMAISDLGRIPSTMASTFFCVRNCQGSLPSLTHLS